MILILQKRGGKIMPELKCTVQTCVHNNQFLCNLEKIQVGGDTAKTAQETCCDSFQERKEGSYMNNAAQQMASDRANVDCRATECMYNEKCQCYAGRISVEGGDAHQSSATECATFKCCSAK